jgi:hypothetical protein
MRHHLKYLLTTISNLAQFLISYYKGLQGSGALHRYIFTSVEVRHSAGEWRYFTYFTSKLNPDMREMWYQSLYVPCTLAFPGLSG